MIAARVAPNGAGGFRCWWNDGVSFGWHTFVSFDDALAVAVRFVSSRNGGGPVSLDSDGERAAVRAFWLADAGDVAG